MKKSAFENHLKNYSCHLKRQGAKHEVWINTKNNKISTVPRHQELKNLLCKKICKVQNILPGRTESHHWRSKNRCRSGYRRNQNKEKSLPLYSNPIDRIMSHVIEEKK